MTADELRLRCRHDAAWRWPFPNCLESAHRSDRPYAGQRPQVQRERLQRHETLLRQDGSFQGFTAAESVGTASHLHTGGVLNEQQRHAASLSAGGRTGRPA